MLPAPGAAAIKNSSHFPNACSIPGTSAFERSRHPSSRGRCADGQRRWGQRDKPNHMPRVTGLGRAGIRTLGCFQGTQAAFSPRGWGEEPPGRAPRGGAWLLRAAPSRSQPKVGFRPPPNSQTHCAGKENCRFCLHRGRRQLPQAVAGVFLVPPIQK